MNLLLQRYKDDGDTTLGKLYEAGPDYMKFLCHTLEDEKRDLKVRGETRIPAGRYEIKERKVLSGLTKKYRNRFKWFKWHLEVQNVPDFQYVYLHVGIKDEHTDGCILLGDSVYENQMVIANSVNAFERIYPLIIEALKEGPVYIEVRDEVD